MGSISEEEAKRMTKVLGGQIIAEKSAPINYDALPNAKDYKRKVVVGKVSQNTTVVSGKGASGSAPAPKKDTPTLPDLTAKERNLMDHIMMDDDFKIKPNYGLFNFVRRFKKNGLETLRHGFVQYTLKADIDHLNDFIETTKMIIFIAPETYKEKIMTSTEDKFRFLKLVGMWNIRDIRSRYTAIAPLGNNATVTDLIPLVKSIYKMLMKIYYLGESRISNFYKEIYGDLVKYPKIDQKAVSVNSKKAIAEWFYVYSQVIKGLYPLLMRMCSKHFDYFQDFFLTQTANIFAFLELTKFDLILPQKKGDQATEIKDIGNERSPEEIQAEEEKKAQEEKEKAEQREQQARKNEYVKLGLRLLNQFFPEAGFDQLSNYPDMFPYFQPIYQFRDGYNLLSPLNPLQITITILRISEDLFQGLRNVSFTIDTDTEESKNADKVSDILNEWSVYRDSLFEKYYCEAICEFVNTQYTQPEFQSTLFGKRLLTSLLWQTKYNFLPNFEFEQLLLEHPKNDSQYRPLCMRVDFMFEFLYSIVKEIDVAAKTKGDVLSVSNPWARYDFGIPNPISKRMDVLLGAKRADDETSATNANLIKYSLYVIAVLDWWINDPSSPAYLCDSSKIYRISPDDGAPLFSVPLRDDQNKLFAQSVKAAIEKKKSES
ncbi:MAG: hypothetical protein II921_04290 [Treponema sp.]|nr:hypothetical protein [Treponema sp.]